MIRSLWRALLRPGLRSLHGRNRSPWGRLPLSVERLEDRWLPATFLWVNPLGGDFATPANWQDQTGSSGLPGAADDALILLDGVTVTSTAANAVRKLTST